MEYIRLLNEISLTNIITYDFGRHHSNNNVYAFKFLEIQFNSVKGG